MNGGRRQRLMSLCRYELWGICAGYDCEYPLELLVKPFSKTKMKVTLALALEKRNPV